MFLAILSWKTVVDAGLPLWCNDSNMILPGEKGPQVVQLKKVLHDTFTLCGRCARVIQVNESDKRDESKSNLTIPAPKSICAPDRHRSALQFNAGLSSFLVLGTCAYHFISSLQNYAQDGNRCIFHYHFALVFTSSYLLACTCTGTRSLTFTHGIFILSDRPSSWTTCSSIIY